MPKTLHRPFKRGDRVRVAFDAEVRRPLDNGHLLVQFSLDGERVSMYPVPADVLTLTAPAPVEVGDTVDRDGIANLPVGTVFNNVHGLHVVVGNRRNDSTVMLVAPATEDLRAGSLWRPNQIDQGGTVEFLPPVTP